MAVQFRFFDKHRGRNFGYGERATMEASGLNPASDLLSGEQLGNKERMAGIHIDIVV